MFLPVMRAGRSQITGFIKRQPEHLVRRRCAIRRLRLITQRAASPLAATPSVSERPMEREQQRSLGHQTNSEALTRQAPILRWQPVFREILSPALAKHPVAAQLLPAVRHSLAWCLARQVVYSMSEM